ncbi:MAG TPA: hypothetical protein VH309_02095, partial [Elusimicrobiota bacterium]|nr:hypothetical protein [Elusimicrobiota bacterium]
MRCWALLLLLATGGTANAALPRVALESPLAPVSAPAFAAAPSALSVTAAPLFSAAAPALGAAPALNAALAPLSPAPVPAAASAASAALPALPAAAALMPAAPAAADGPKANVPLAGELSRSGADASAESSAAALETRFDGAASIRDAAAEPATAERDPLLASLLKTV